MAEIYLAALGTAANVRIKCCVDDRHLLAGGNKMNGKFQKMLLPATLTEEDEFYAECNAKGLKSFVDRVNGKVVRAYPYWIDRPNCNWHSPPVAEEEEDEDDEDFEEDAEYYCEDYDCDGDLDEYYRDPYAALKKYQQYEKED